MDGIFFIHKKQITKTQKLFLAPKPYREVKINSFLLLHASTSITSILNRG